MTATPLTTERYELAERIAVGGMAEVFRAKAVGAHGFEKLLAIKRILPDLAREPEFEQRFIAEAKLAVKLSHANIVQVLDFGHLAGTLFIAMELIDGLDLSVLLRRHAERGERVPLPAALHIAIEVARGLDFAHSSGVVHRDVSPSNILLSRAGEVKIADFGIATASELWSGNVDRRRIMGKWRYMSPEQSRGEPMGPASDLFSAAAVLFELFTGQKLFPGDDADEIARNIRRMELPRASELRPGLPPRLDAVLGAALERDPGRRTTRAADMLRALIETSYESSIVASALDVADVVRDVLGVDDGAAAGRAAIDDLIRAQLAGAADPQRSTAVGPGEPDAGQTASLRRRVDADGVTHLEPLAELEHRTVAAVPSALDARRRASGAEPARPRRRGLRGRTVAIAATAAIALAGVAVALAVSGGPGDGAGARAAPPAAVLADGGAAIATAELDLRSVPPGATVWVDEVALDQLTPTRITVAADRPHVVALELAGYRRYVDEAVTPRGGERLRLSTALVPLRARLEVVTTPIGAEVRIGDRSLGVTPLARDDLAPGPVELAIEKPGFRREVVAVVLAEGEPRRIERRLRSAVASGQLNIHIVDSWAEVREGARVLGRAPGTFHLPAGKHNLRLYNPASGRQKDVAVDVLADEVGYYSFSL